MIKTIALIIALTLGLGVERPITIHLAGDSTMAEKQPDKRPETGWGEMLQQYFPANLVRVMNHAKNGRSTRTFISEGLWQQLLDSTKAGDYVFIEFGHNDEVPSKVDRYTPPDQYRVNLARMVADTRAKQAIPVLLTPVARRKFEKNGTVADSHHAYSEIVRDVAHELHVPLIDMDRKSAALLAIYGEENSKKLFLQVDSGVNANYPHGVHDNTHFSPAGAQEMARIAVEGMREQKLDVVKYITEPGVEIEKVGPAKTKTESLLSDARIDSLPQPLRAAWQLYIAASDSVRAADQRALSAELQAAGESTWTPAPTDAGFFMTDSMTAQWLSADSAGKLADYIVSYQAPNGGWSKRMGFTHMRAPGEAFTSAENETWLSTVDNGATNEELRFLGARMNATRTSTYARAFGRGLEYLFVSQTPVGCWPQIFPLAGSYHDALTYNDDATVNALSLLRDVAKGMYPFVTSEMRTRAALAVRSGIDCILKTQYVQNGVKTAWGAQHDPITLLPAKARAYEHASLSGREGASILKFLLQVPDPSPEVVQSIEAAAAWFRKSAIYGYSYAYKGELKPQTGAGPIWARFYELGTNRPIFSDRDSVIRYSLSEIGPERRYGYAWYTDEPASVLKRYDKWARIHLVQK